LVDRTDEQDREGVWFASPVGGAALILIAKRNLIVVPVHPARHLSHRRRRGGGQGWWRVGPGN
jgi:hypothetical protein